MHEHVVSSEIKDIKNKQKRKNVLIFIKKLQNLVDDYQKIIKLQAITSVTMRGFIKLFELSTY